MRCASRGALVSVVLAASAMGACSRGSGSGLPHFVPEERPNVLIVLVDVLRRDHLGVYGYPLPTSPNIDAFAGDGFLFEQAFSHSTWTKPSVATLFTSVYSDQHGLGRVGFEDDAGFHTDVLPARLETLAEVLQAAGYRTGSVGANVHIQQKTGFAQGFEKFWMKRQTWAPRLTRQFQKWLDQGTEGQPFFAYVHYMDVHWPYRHSLPGSGRKFGPTRLDKEPPQTWTAVPNWAAEHLDDEALAALRARYDSEIEYVDASFGDLIADLETRGVLDDTVVVFVGDHGEGFYEHGRLQHSFQPFPEVTGVPLILRLPPVFGVQPGRSTEVVGLVDVMPTVLELVGLEIPEAAQGRSLVPLMLGERLRERPVYADGEGMRVMRSSRHTVFLDREGASTCYERQADPMELAPLATPVEACTRMSSALETLVRGFESLAANGEPGSTVAFDDEEIEELRALGYLD